MWCSLQERSTSSISAANGCEVKSLLRFRNSLSCSWRCKLWGSFKYQLPLVCSSIWTHVYFLSPTSCLFLHHGDLKQPCYLYRTVTQKKHGTSTTTTAAAVAATYLGAECHLIHMHLKRGQSSNKRELLDEAAGTMWEKRPDISLSVLKHDTSWSWQLPGKQMCVQEVNKKLKDRDTGVKAAGCVQPNHVCVCETYITLTSWT